MARRGIFGIGLALLSLTTLATASDENVVHVFVLAGQSNMEGKAKLSLLEHQIRSEATKARFAHLHEDGEWVERDDVFISFLDRRGKLKVGFGSPNCIGPELEFGSVVGDHYDEPVLIIKTAWGGKSLGRDFRPPSAGLPDKEALAAILAKTNEENAKRQRPLVRLEDVQESYGHFYRLMIENIRTNLAELDQRFPELKGRQPVIEGFVWFQGWNDMSDEDFVSGYESHLAALIHDVRKDLGAPDLPVVIGQMGQNGFEPAEGAMAKIKAAQAAVAEHEDLKGTVRSVATDVYWDPAAAALIDGWRNHVDEWNKVGSDFPYHYLGSAITFSEIGRAFGKAMLELKQ
ncbi:MAG: sialate O-acetylesterase [Planctomycetota bacterium]